MFLQKDISFPPVFTFEFFQFWGMLLSLPCLLLSPLPWRRGAAGEPGLLTAGVCRRAAQAACAPRRSETSL